MFNGQLYKGASGAGVLVRSSNEWTQAGASWPTANGGADGACSLLTDAEGIVYAGTGNNGVWMLENGAWTQVGTSGPSGDTLCGLADVDGRVYAGTDGGVWDWSGTVWTQVSDIPFPTEEAVEAEAAVLPPWR